MLKERIILAVIALLGPTSAAHAQFAECDVTDAQPRNYSELAAHYARECVDQSELAPNFKLHIERIQTKEGDERVAALVHGLQSVDMMVRGLPQANPAASSDFSRALQCDIRQLGGAADASLQCPGIEDGLTVLFEQKWAPGRMPGVSGVVFNTAIVDPMQSMLDGCAAAAVAPDDPCDAIFRNQFIPVLEVHSIMHNQFVPASNDKVATAVAKHYSDTHQQWKNYLSDSGFQYPWELTFNKWRHGGFEEIARNRPAPSSRYIVAHPTVGIYYSDDLPDGGDADLIAILKLFGYKRWGWDTETNKPKNVLGISLTSTAADLAGVDDLGMGVLLEYNQFSLGYSKHGGTGIYMLNVDLANFLSNKPSDLPGWLELLADKD